MNQTNIKFQKDKNQREETILKDTNKNVKSRKLPLFLGDQKEYINKKLQNKQNSEVGILKHCSNMKLIAHKIRGTSYSLLNSCPFDSLAQAFYVIGTDDESINKMVGNQIL